MEMGGEKFSIHNKFTCFYETIKRTTFGSNTPEAYERLVLDAMIGDGTLFIRGDEAETSWRLYTPVLESWAAAGREGMESYPSGSWGPANADELLSRSNHVWRQP